MTDLIERLKHATGPSRELDVEIVFHLYPEIGAYQPHCVGDEPIFYHEPYRKQPCPEFTASLDAALTLVPEGFDWILEHVNGGLTIGARVGTNDPDKTAFGENAAIAVCIAAIRARAELS